MNNININSKNNTTGNLNQNNAAKIPNQNNISEILFAAIQNQERTVLIINEMISIAINSPAVNRSNVNILRDVIQNTTDIIHILVDSLVDISGVLKKSKPIISGICDSLYFSGIQDLTTYKAPQVAKDKYSIFDQYIFLLSFCSEISSVSSIVDRAAIRNGKKAIIATLDAVEDIYFNIARRTFIVFALNSKITSKIINNFRQSTQYIIEIINSTVNDILLTLIESPVADKNNINILKDIIHNTTDIIYILSDALFDINAAITEIQSIFNGIKLSNFLSFSGRQNILTGKIDDDNNSIFDRYVYLLSICSEITSISKTVDKKSVKNGKKAIIATIDAVVDIYASIVKNSLLNKFLNSKFASKMLNNFSTASENLIAILVKNLNSIASLIQSNKYTPKDIRKSVKSIFALYNYILWKSFILSLKIDFIYKPRRIAKGFLEFLVLSILLGKVFDKFQLISDQIIRFGNKSLTVILGLTMFNKIIKDLIELFVKKITKTQLLYASSTLITFIILFLPLLRHIFKRLNTVINELILLGEKYFKIRMGLDVLTVIFTGSRTQKSIFESFSGIHMWQSIKLLVALTSISVLHKICLRLGTVIDLLIKAGNNYIRIRLGMRAIDLIFNTSPLSLINRKSLIAIFSGLGAKTALQLKNGLPTIALLLVMMVAMSQIITTLIMAGRNFVRIRRGIRVIDYIVGKIPAILLKITLIDKKVLLLAILKFAILDILFAEIGIAIAALAVSAVASAAAILAMLSIIIICTLTVGLLLFIHRFHKIIYEGSKDLFIMTSCLMIFALSMENIVALSINWMAVIFFMGSLILCVTLFTIASYLIKTITAASLITFILISLVLFTAGVALAKISALDINSESIKEFAVAMLMIMGVCVVLGLITVILPVAVLGVAMLALTITALFIIALELVWFAKIDIKTFDKASQNIDIIFGICHKIIKSFLFSAVRKPQEGDSKFKSILLASLGSVGFIVDAIMMSAFLTFAFISLTTIMLMVGELYIISKINPAIFTDAKNNIEKIFDTLGFIMDLFLRDPQKNKPAKDRNIWQSFLTYVCAPIGNIIEAIFAMAALSVAVITVTAILFIAGELRLIQELNLDENQITLNVKKVLGTIDSINEILNKKPTKKKNDDQPWYKRVLSEIPIIGKATNLIDAMANMASVAVAMISIGMVSLIAKNLVYLQKLQLDDKAIRTNVGKLFNICTLISSKINKGAEIDRKKVKSFSLCVDQITNLANGVSKISTENTNNLEKIFRYIIPKKEDIDGIDIADYQVHTGELVDHYSKFIDKANTIDTDKIKTVTEMLGKMADFSNSISGNFEKLADTLNGKLLDTLVEIKDILGGINENPVNVQEVNSTSKNPSQFINPTNVFDSVDKNMNTANNKSNNTNEAFTKVVSKLDDLISEIRKTKNEVTFVAPAANAIFTTTEK